MVILGIRKLFEHTLVELAVKLFKHLSLIFSQNMKPSISLLEKTSQDYNAASTNSIKTKNYSISSVFWYLVSNLVLQLLNLRDHR